jgi:aminoglycoside phosphotransferase (APT) family kinase protein
LEGSKGYTCALTREYRALSHIHPVFDRAPRAYAYCEDESVIGAPFIVMERQAGVRSAIPAAFLDFPGFARQLIALKCISIGDGVTQDFKEAFKW